MLSAVRTRVSKRKSISAWPPVATSWCWRSILMPSSSMTRHISVRIAGAVWYDLRNRGRAHQGVEAKINLGLAAGGHFMVLALDLDAQFLHDQAHLGADVLLGVVGGDGEITLLVADFIAQVGGFVPAAVPDGLLRVHRVEGAVAFGVELHVVKNKEFGLRPEDGGGRHARG